MNLVIEPHPKFGSLYCRSTNSSRQELEKEFINLYQQNPKQTKCAILPSGMTAIGLVMDSIISLYPDSVFILSSELYCDTNRTVKYINRRCPSMTYEFVDIRNHKNLKQLFNQHKDKIKLFFIESCSNPSGQVFDFDLYVELKKLAPNCVLCVDNTWLSGAQFNPFNVNADLVLESITKYVSRGKCIGGMILGHKKLMNPILEWVRTMGQFVGADHCQIFIEGLKTLPTRMKYLSELGKKISISLEKHPKVVRVMYPTLESHPTHKQFQKYMGSEVAPGCIWFCLSTKLPLEECKKILKENSRLTYETSFGSSYSKLDPWPCKWTSRGYEYPNGDSKVPDLEVVWIRLSIGYEDSIENLINACHELIKDFQ